MNLSTDGAIPLTTQDNPVSNDPAKRRGLLGRDFLVLLLFCLVLFGYEMFSGRALSLHEARLPETSRQMLVTHQWLFPHSGTRPWLERPPLPHWIVIGVSLLLGQRVDSVWVVRLPSALMGLSVVLMTAWMAGLWFGRDVGRLSGFVLATMYEFYAYSVLAEDDIYLAAAVTLAIALFVAIEFFPRGQEDARVGFFGNRPWCVWALFFVLGLMNIVKSPLLGDALALGPIGAFLLLSGDVRRIRRYIWLWGWLMFAVLLAWWMLAAIHRFPDVKQNWRFDYESVTQYDEPFWYYPVVALLAFCEPWILASITGFMVTARKARDGRVSGARFLWCWAIVPVILLSIHHRKHHHYLVPSIAPWAILSAIGLSIIWRDLVKMTRKPINPIAATLVVAALAAGALWHFHAKIDVPMKNVAELAVVLLACVGFFFLGLSRKVGIVAAAACFVGVAIGYCWGQSLIPDLVTQDTAFLHRVDREVPRDQPLYVNADLGGEMDFFRNQFYLRPDSILLHNLTFLRDDRITAPTVWVVTRQRDLPKLQTLGTVSIKDESAHTRREREPDYRFTLFELHFRPDLKRYPATAYINTLQAMDREKGPWCGPPFDPVPRK